MHQRAPSVALGHVVTVSATVLFGGLKWRHRATVATKDDAFEQVLRLGSGRVVARTRLLVLQIACASSQMDLVVIGVYA